MFYTIHILCVLDMKYILESEKKPDTDNIP